MKIVKTMKMRMVVTIPRRLLVILLSRTVTVRQKNPKLVTKTVGSIHRIKRRKVDDIKTKMAGYV